jgi:hypothetical protein
VLWLTGKTTSAIGTLVGSLVMIATLFVSLPFIAVPSRSLVVPWVASFVIWAVFAAVFLLTPRWKGSVGRLVQSFAARLTGASYVGGGEVDFLIGTARPWGLALVIIVPVSMIAWFLSGFEVMAPSAPSPVLFFMTILSILAGAIASLAATRGRRLWLRAPWTRAQLFRRVEDALWRHGSPALGVLLVLFVVLGSQTYAPTEVLAYGMGLVMLGIALSTYLGLMITAPIGWLDAALAVIAMVALMVAADYASKPTTPMTFVLVFEAALAAFALLLRAVAQRRWAQLDWMRCRADTTVRAAT